MLTGSFSSWLEVLKLGRQIQMPLDAFRKGDTFLISLDLPGVSAESVDLTVEDNVLTIKAERPAPPRSEDVEVLIAEQAYGTYIRQVFLGTNLDTEHIEAQYQAGVSDPLDSDRSACQAAPNPSPNSERERTRLRVDRAGRPPEAPVLRGSKGGVLASGGETCRARARRCRLTARWDGRW